MSQISPHLTSSQLTSHFVWTEWLWSESVCRGCDLSEELGLFDDRLTVFAMSQGSLPHSPSAFTWAAFSLVAATANWVTSQPYEVRSVGIIKWDLLYEHSFIGYHVLEVFHFYDTSVNSTNLRWSQEVRIAAITYAVYYTSNYWLVIALTTLLSCAVSELHLLHVRDFLEYIENSSEFSRFDILPAYYRRTDHNLAYTALAILIFVW